VAELQSELKSMQAAVQQASKAAEEVRVEFRRVTHES
jgi:hypothetical protein